MFLCKTVNTLEERAELYCTSLSTEHAIHTTLHISPFEPVVAAAAGGATSCVFSTPVATHDLFDLYIVGIEKNTMGRTDKPTRAWDVLRRRVCLMDRAYSATKPQLCSYTASLRWRPSQTATNALNQALHTSVHVFFVVGAVLRPFPARRRLVFDPFYHDVFQHAVERATK